MQRFVVLLAVCFVALGWALWRWPTSGPVRVLMSAVGLPVAAPTQAPEEAASTARVRAQIDEVRRAGKKDPVQWE